MLLTPGFSGKGPVETIAHEALALTKMHRNNEALYDPVPVSIRYSQRLARTIAKVADGIAILGTLAPLVLATCFIPSLDKEIGV